MSFQVKWIYDLVDNLSPALKRINKNLEATSSGAIKLGTKVSTGFDKVKTNLDSVNNKVKTNLDSINNKVNSFSFDRFARVSRVALRNIDRGFNRFNENLNDSADRIKNFTKDTAGLSASLGVVGVMSLRQAANFETASMQMEILSGSVEKGNKLYKDLIKLGAETPFEMAELMNGTKTMMGFGIEADRAFENIKRISDIAALTGGSIDGIALAFSQSAAAGRVMGEDILRFINNGVPIIDILAKTMKKPTKEIKELGSNGKITFDILERAFIEATSEGGKFNSGAIRLSSTLGGLYSTLKDNVNMALMEFGVEISKVLELKDKMKDLPDILGKLNESFKGLSPEVKEWIIYGGLALIGFTALGGALTLIMSGLNPFIPIISYLLRFATLNFVPLILAFIIIKKYGNQLLEIFKKVLEIFAKIGKGIGADKFINKIATWIGFDPIFKEDKPMTQPQMSYAPMKGGLDVNFANLPKGASVSQRQSTPNFNLGLNTTYAR